MPTYTPVLATSPGTWNVNGKAGFPVAGAIRDSTCSSASRAALGAGWPAGPGCQQGT